MRDNDPLSVTVIIPAFNSRATLARAIQSVRAQAIGVREIIVVDDKSTDGTAEFARELGDDIIVVQNPENQGPSAARNSAIARARGSVIAFLDADDYWYPWKLDQQLRVFAENPQIALCCSGVCWFETQQSVPEITRPDQNAWILQSFGEIVRDPYLGTPTVIVRTEALRSVGGFDTSLRYAEDVDLWMRIAEQFPIARFSSVMTAVAISPSSLTQIGGEQVDRGNLEVLYRWRTHRPEATQKFGREFDRVTAAVYTRLASGRMSRGDTDAARSALRLAIRYDSGYVRAWYLLFRSYFPLSPRSSR
jgi:glycosyltransferase involved in cell wall biosynthesis